MNRKAIYSKFTSITLERTGCLGGCPIYKVEIKSNGNVVYVGERFVDLEGVHTWDIESEAVELLNDTIKKYGFFNIKKKKPIQIITCMPHCILTIKREDKSKRKINDYLGDDSYPARLRTLERKIDKIIGVQKYTGI